jgi:hypothetical protein
MDDAVELLEQTLEEEKETDQRLTEIAEANINQGAGRKKMRKGKKTMRKKKQKAAMTMTKRRKNNF